MAGIKSLLKKLKLSLGIIPLIFFTINNAGSAQAQTNENFDFVNNKFKYAPKYATTAHKMLQIEDSILLNYISSSQKKFYSTELAAFPDLKTLDSLIDNSKAYIEKKESYTKDEIKKISENIFLDVFKKIPSIKERNDLCYRMSLVYLAIGGENGIPFYASLLPRVPGHIIIRYDSDGKHDPINSDNPINKGDINIEPTTGKIEDEKGNSDAYFISQKCLSKESLEKNSWMKNLSEKELFGLAYLHRAPRNRKYDPPQTFKDCKKALELFPNYYVIPWTIAKTLENIRDWPPYYEALKKSEKSEQYYQKAIELNPEPAMYFDYARYCNLKLKDYKKAIQNYTNALNLISKLKQECVTEPYISQLEIDCILERKGMYEKIEDYENAQKDFETFMKISIGPMIKVPNAYEKEQAKIK